MSTTITTIVPPVPTLVGELINDRIMCHTGIGHEHRYPANVIKKMTESIYSICEYANQYGENPHKEGRFTILSKQRHVTSVPIAYFVKRKDMSGDFDFIENEYIFRVQLDQSY